MMSRETHEARCTNEDCCGGTVITDFGMRFKCHRCGGIGRIRADGPAPVTVHLRTLEEQVLALSAQLSLRDVEIGELREQLDRYAKCIMDRDARIEALQGQKEQR